MKTAEQYRAISLEYAEGKHKAKSAAKKVSTPELPRSNRWLRQRAAENKATKAEKTMKILLDEWLTPLGVEFYAQVPVLSYIADFYVPSKRLVIEIDGEYHFVRENHDNMRTKRLNQHGYQVIRFTNHEVMNNPVSMRNVIIENVVGTHAVTH